MKEIKDFQILNKNHLIISKIIVLSINNKINLNKFTINNSNYNLIKKITNKVFMIVFCRILICIKTLKKKKKNPIKDKTLLIHSSFKVIRKMKIKKTYFDVIIEFILVSI